MRLMLTSSGDRRAPGLAVLAVLVLAALAALHSNAAQAQSQSQSQSRGELLYNTNCVACHNEKMHWRGRKLVYDWDSLEEQVRRWQQASSLGWRDEDIMEVARYLNGRFYGFTPTSTTGLLKSSVPAPSAADPKRAALPDRP
ncbi:Cytochrome c, mono-and diheme variants [Variovorax sp. YR634]|uniref:c-type cytochrome n=1 Tax=unclassified Variovorax TaxID=663243 RepID=UPI000896F83E|nr:MULTISPECIES: cytochrome c [unclassified Variovorax]SDZ47771.1 Cytochrome c, mono-and diheme variants [Variovorax sp. YR634]SOD28545.1 Cytochrome c, mono- and diheme variants [Variovorax sp. YR752]